MAHPIRLALAGLIAVVALGACSDSSGSNESADDADQLAHNACNGLLSVLERQQDIAPPVDTFNAQNADEAFAELDANATAEQAWGASVREAFSSDLDPLVELTARAAKRDASWDALHVAMTNSMVTGSKDPAIAAECTKALAG